LNLIDEGRCELQRRIISFDPAFDLSYWQVGQVAGLVAPAKAEEVGIELTVTAARLSVDQSARPAILVTALAEKHALEVVEDHPVTLASRTAGFENLLNLVEEGLADDRFMPPGEQLTFVGPAVLLADELTAELDHASRQRVLDRVFALADNGSTVVICTHDPEVAARCHRQIELTNGRLTSSR
jgi:hypothetical protein